MPRKGGGERVNLFFCSTKLSEGAKLLQSLFPHRSHHTVLGSCSSSKKHAHSSSRTLPAQISCYALRNGEGKLSLLSKGERKKTQISLEIMKLAYKHKFTIMFACSNRKVLLSPALPPSPTSPSLLCFAHADGKS